VQRYSTTPPCKKTHNADLVWSHPSHPQGKANCKRLLCWLALIMPLIPPPCVLANDLPKIQRHVCRPTSLVGSRGYVMKSFIPVSQIAGLKLSEVDSTWPISALSVKPRAWWDEASSTKESLQGSQPKISIEKTNQSVARSTGMNF
jgi:hypothetical protein